MLSDRERIIAEARGWIGTPFHHQGRVKGEGCDCIGLIVSVAKNLNIPCIKKSASCIAELDQTDYTRLPDGNRLYSELKKYLFEIPKEKIELADILLMHFDGNPQHVGLVSDYPEEKLGIIHCFADVGRVVEHRLDDYWQKKIVSAFSFYRP